MPDEEAAARAGDRLATLDIAGAGLGHLVRAVTFAAGTQGTEIPQPWRAVRVLLLHADHDGGVAAGDPPAESARRLSQAERGEGALALLAGAAGVDLAVARCPGGAAPIEREDAMSAEAVDVAVRHGWRLAEAAVDAGADLLVLAACGAGAEASAVAVTAMIIGAEAAGMLGRALAPGGRIDDEAWMSRCAAVRDALHRVRYSDRDPRRILAALGGPDLAVATGLLLGAVSRHWLMLPDDGGHPMVKRAADTLGTQPLFDLRVGLGEGASALAALPLLRSALALAANLGPSTVVGGGPEPAAVAPDDDLRDEV